MDDQALRSTWRRAGFDVMTPDARGVRDVAFPKQRGHARDKLMPAASSAGLQTYVRELDQEVINASAALLRAVAPRLTGDAGAPRLELESKHEAVDLASRACVHVTVLEGWPPTVLVTLLEAFAVSNPRRCVEASLLPFFSACEVPAGLSGNDAEPASTTQKHTQLDKYLAERAALTKSRTKLHVAW